MYTNYLSAASVRTKNPAGVIATCGLMIMFDGYDLVVYGAVAPALLKESAWALNPAMVGRAAALTLVGMLLGALFAGTMADRIGRRKVVLLSLAGLGLGALLPTVTALVLEFSPPQRRAQANSLSFLGYLIGGIISGVMGILLLETYGWRPLMLIGGLPLVLLPIFMRFLPESPEWLASKGRQAEADGICDSYGLQRIAPHAKIQKGGVGALFSEGRLLSTLNAWGIHFCSLLLTFGMVNWLPTIMNRMGYDISSALSFSVMLNVGAAIGILIGGRFADKGNVKVVVAILFAIGAASIFALTVNKGPLLYAFVALAGAGTIGTQILANVLVGRLYPVHIRGTGLGFSLAVGRLGGIAGPMIGGLVLQRGLAPEWNFYIFGSVALVGLMLTVLTLLYRTSGDARV